MSLTDAVFGADVDVAFFCVFYYNVIEGESITSEVNLITFRETKSEPVAFLGF